MYNSSLKLVKQILMQWLCCAKHGGVNDSIPTSRRVQHSRGDCGINQEFISKILEDD